jgi:hypothetical protein
MRQYEDNESTLTQLLAMADVRLPVTAAYQRFDQLVELDGDRVGRAILDTYQPDRMCWSLVTDPHHCDAVAEHFGELRGVTRTPEQLIGN